MIWAIYHDYLLKNKLEKLINKKFSYVVLNYYRNGSDYIGYHADREIKIGSSVVSISLGASRRFYLKSKYDKNIIYKYVLNNGDILILNEAAIKNGECWCQN